MGVAKNVVVIGSDRLEPAEMLAADPEVELSVICKPKYAHLYRDLARDIRPVDDVADLAQARAAAREMLSRHPVDAVVAVIERAVLTGGFLRSLLDLPGPGFDLSLRCTDKYIMKRCLARAGIPVAPHSRLDDPGALPRVAERLGGWPVLLKPALGSGTMHQQAFPGPDSWRAFAAGGGLEPLTALGVPLVVERFLEVEREYHCDSVIGGGEVLFAAVGCYLTPPLRQTGFGGVVLLDDADPEVREVLRLNAMALGALGLRDAVTHLEVLRTPQGPVVGEVALRPGGGGIQEALRFKYGRGLTAAFVQASIGRPPDLPGAPRKGVVGVLGLPCANGRVVSITPEAELARLPGVVDVRLNRAVGDVIAEKLTSVFYSGLVLLQGPSEQAVREAVSAVLESYRLEVAPD